MEHAGICHRRGRVHRLALRAHVLAGGYPGFEDAEVTVFDKLTYAGNLDEPRAGRRQTRATASCRATSAIAAQLDEALPGHDVVVHFAAETHVDRSIYGAADFVVTNVLGTQTLFDACAARRHRPRRARLDRRGLRLDRRGFVDRGRTSLEPNSPYSASKAGADLLARAYAGTYGLNISVTRCTNNYGPYQFPEKVIPLFITNLIDGRRCRSTATG